MSRRYRIAHLLTLLELGGAQQNTLYSVRHHDRRYFDVALLAGAGAQLDDEARAIPDADVHLVDWLPHPIRPATDLIAIERMRRWFKEQRIDLVHTHSSKAGILGRIAAQLAGVPAVVHTVHGWSFNATQPRALQMSYRALERFVAPWTDRILVVAANHRESGLDAGIGREAQYRIVRSGIDADRFVVDVAERQRLRQEWALPDDAFVFGTVTNMKPQKAPLDFVAVAARACRAEPRLHFVFAGDGPLMPEVRQAVEQEGLSDRIRLLGWRDDVPELLAAFDGFLLTSHFEGLPRVVLQATAAGRPVVATAVDGTPEVIEDGVSGWLAAAGDVDGLASAVLECVAEPTTACHRVGAAQKRLQGSFHLRTMVQQLDRLYLELLQGRC